MQSASPRSRQESAESGLAQAWRLYFPGTDYQPNDRRALLMHEAAEHLAEPCGAQLLTQAQALQDRCVVQLDYEQLLGACEGSANLAAALELQPVEALACVAAAVHQVRFAAALQGPPD